VSFTPIVYSGPTREAASVAAGNHGSRIWPIDEKHFGTVPTIMLANLVRSGADEQAWTLALLFGACDQGSSYDYEQMLRDFGEDLVDKHRAASWTEMIVQRGADRVYDWSDAAIALRSQIDRAPPVSRLVWLAYEHFRITAMMAMGEEHGLDVWHRFFQGFPGPYNQYEALRDPYGFIVQYYRQLFHLHNQDARHGRVLLNEILATSRDMERAFGLANLI